MPPSWPSRLLSGSHSSSPTNGSTQPSSSRPGNRPPPVVQPHHPDSYPGPGPPSPSRTAESPRQHGRSTSHPLPRIFGRKKSLGTLKGLDVDGPPDDTLVPVLDDPLTASPTRATHGKKRLDQDPNVTRPCICCSTKCRFPRGLTVFRCTSCLTINDLEQHVTDNKAKDDVNAQDSKTSSFVGPKPILPLSVERTRAIIDQCLITYLEARSKGRRGVTPERAPLSPTKVEMQLPERSSSIHSPKNLSTSPTKTRRPVSPPNQGNSTATDLKPKASIRDFSDFKQFGFSTSLDEALVPSIDPSFPGTAPVASPPTSPGVQRKPVPDQPFRKPPPPPGPPSNGLGPSNQLPRPPTVRYKTPPEGSMRQRQQPPLPGESRLSEELESYDRVKKIFKPLEDYLNENYGRHESLNMSFSTARPKSTGRAASEGSVRAISDPVNTTIQSPFDYGAQIDAKTLLLGDVAENGDWWTGRLERNSSERRDSHGNKLARKKGMVSSKSPMIDWEKMDNWYSTVHRAGQSWWDKLSDMDPAEHSGLDENTKGAKNTHEIEMEIATARGHAERALLKVTENILKRPGRPLQDPEDMRFLILILMNPSLYPSSAKTKARVDSVRPRVDRAPSSAFKVSSNDSSRDKNGPPESPSKISSKEYGQHNGILKRVFGLLANSPDSCQRYLVNWFARLPEARFRDLVDLVASFITYRLSKRRVRPRTASTPMDNGLIPDLSGSAMQTSAQLQSASGLGGSLKKRDDDGVQSVADYSEDWQLRAAAKVMALLFAANNIWHKTDASQLPQPAGLTRPRTIAHGQLMPTSDFYNTLLDYTDLIADFKVWESRKAKFTFCQYPFLLSIGSKTRILEYDARRQMENKAREAYFDNVTSGRSADIYLNLHVRRECVVDDSLRQISEAVGTGQEELKKGLRVKFTGEEGIDAGGLRKEWFLMLVRDIFDPNHGMFLYDDVSQTCYFNPSSFETSDQYYLVGILLGLAIYNSTILDIALPPFAFRKLLASAPSSAANPSLPTAGAKGIMTYTVDDLAEYNPSLAAGLRQLLEFEGDVEATFCRDFVAPTERYGTVINTPLCPGGENKAVTNANRQEFVDLYIRYLLDTSVARQFEPFKRGFFAVCAGNALSLFRAEEIELLIRGSDEALDVDSLKAVAVYDNWRDDSGKLLPRPEDQVPVIAWFWDAFASASASEQRKILGFITGSDRIPAAGAANLVLRITGGGDGTGKVEKENGGRGTERFPIARTCFNMLVLWRYETREKLESKLRGAVEGSEGFGLK